MRPPCTGADNVALMHLWSAVVCAMGVTRDGAVPTSDRHAATRPGAADAREALELARRLSDHAAHRWWMLTKTDVYAMGRVWQRLCDTFCAAHVGATGGVVVVVVVVVCAVGRRRHAAAVEHDPDGAPAHDPA